jgi:hypothetical protein
LIDIPENHCSWPCEAMTAFIYSAPITGVIAFSTKSPG